MNRPVLVYDGNCGFCREWVARLGRADRHGRIATVPAAERAAWDLPPLSEEDVSQAMYLVLPDGSMRRGARALPAILRELPGWRWLVPLLRIPGVLWIGDRIYAWIARRRHRFGCGSGKCGLA